MKKFSEHQIRFRGYIPVAHAGEIYNRGECDIFIHVLRNEIRSNRMRQKKFDGYF